MALVSVDFVNQSPQIFPLPSGFPCPYYWTEEAGNGQIHSLCLKYHPQGNCDSSRRSYQCQASFWTLSSLDKAGTLPCFSAKSFSALGKKSTPQLSLVNRFHGITTQRTYTNQANKVH